MPERQMQLSPSAPAALAMPFAAELAGSASGREACELAQSYRDGSARS